MTAETPTDRLPRSERFELVRPLGAGGGGRVRLVRDRRHGGAVRALKLAASPGTDRAGQEESRARLFHEARVLAALVHPGVPRTYEAGRLADTTPWLLMEYVEPAPEPRDPVQVARGLLDVLGYLHRHGWLHHDVKPANVLVSPRGRVVLVDYGLAARDVELVPPRGTLPFVPPEVLAAEPADARSDLWSLGASLLALATGREYPHNAVLEPDDVPDDCAIPANWLRGLLEPDPARRYPSAEVAYGLLQSQMGEAQLTLPVRPLPRTPEPVGRVTELDELIRRLEASDAASRTGKPARAARPTPGMVLVRGESGVGKSRLLAEFRLRAVERGWRVFLGSCQEERDARLPALGSILEAILGESPETSPAVQRRGRAVANLLTARQDRDAAETAARFLLERAAEGDGILILVEDLQSASALTLRVLSFIARVVAAGHTTAGPPPRLFVTGTLTDSAALPEDVVEMLALLEAEGVLWSMPLRPLGPDEVDRLVEEMLGPRAPSGRVAEILRAHGGTLPLFAEELLTRLVKDGALRHEGARWLLDDRVVPRLPANLVGAVSTRLDALPVEDLRAVQILATLERPLPVAGRKRLLGADADTVLTHLEQARFVRPAAEGRAVALEHAVVGQAALALLSPAARAKLHDLVAEGLSSARARGRIRYAFHVARGTDTDAGFRAATQAARRLRAEGEPGRSADFVRQALRLLPEQDPRIPHLRRSLADLLVSSGRPAAASNVYRDLLADQPDPELRARLHAGLADALDNSGRWSDVAKSCNAALAALDERPRGEEDVDLRALRLSVLARLASAQRATGNLRGAIETVKEALAIAEGALTGERTALLSLLGNVYLQMGDVARARQFHESCLAACRLVGRRRDMATAFHNLGVVHAHLGERREAARYYRQSLRLARRAKDLQGVAQTLGNLANLRAEQGDFKGAENLQLKSLALRRRVGDLQGVAVTQGNIAGLKRARGRLGSALSLLHVAVKQLRRLGDAAGEVKFLLETAAVHLFAGDHPGARPLLVRARDRAAEASLRSLEARAELLLGRLERRDDPEGEEWMKRLVRALELSEHVGDRAGMVEAHLEMALGERARGRRGVAKRECRVAAGLLERGASADLRARVDLVLGRQESDREPSGEALAALERFHTYARTSGRRDYRAAGGYALANARFRSGDVEGAQSALDAALRVEEDLTASLPPALRRVRERGVARKRLQKLKDVLEERAAQEAEAASVEASRESMEHERLLKLLEINKRLNQAQDMRGLLDAIMDVATDVTGAERGFLILLEGERIAFQTARNFKREEVRKPELKISQSIVRRVIKSGSAVLTDNATEDARFQDSKSVDRLDLKSIVSIPFRLGEQIIGAMYLDNPARKGAFGPGDLQFLTALADQAALAIKNLRHAHEMEEMNKRLEENLERKSAQLEQASRALDERATKYPYPHIVGQSRAIRQVLLLVDKVVDTEVPVLIQGESGTGKELIARAIHHHGRRKDGPFVPVNCGAIAETLMESELFGHTKGSFTGAVADKKGLFEAADGGTIFLDEIGEMNVDLQKKLLRVLQEREVRPVGGKNVVKVDSRVIAATNKNLRERMQEGKFRQDLYYRVAVINIDLPPLRERADDIPLLVRHFLGTAAKELGLDEKPMDDDALEALKEYDWPGNVRELDNEVKKALTLSDDRITLADLSLHLQGDRAQPEPSLVAAGAPAATLKESLEKTEKVLIEKALEKTGGNQTRAAKELGISRVWLRKKMEKYGLLGKR